jgi:hypothetical protein
MPLPWGGGETIYPFSLQSHFVAQGSRFIFRLLLLLVAALVANFLAPPSSVLRLNPSVSIPKEGDHHRSPFQATIPCGLTMLPWPMILARRNVTV